MSVRLPVILCSWTDNLLTSSGLLFRVSSFTFNTFSVVFLSDTFWKGVVIPICSLRCKFAVTLVASCPEGAFIDLIANSILGATLLLIAVKIAFWIPFSTVSTILLIFLSILSLKHLSKVFTFTVFSLVNELSQVPTVRSRSAKPSLNIVVSCLWLAVLPIIISWSKSSNWLRSLLLHCF